MLIGSIRPYGLPKLRSRSEEARASLDHALAVGCEGPSIHVGEESGIENGVTGSRQLICCATPSLVTGSLADRGDRGDIVEIVVDPNGMTDWRVVVVAGQGSTGPFREH